MNAKDLSPCHALPLAHQLSTTLAVSNDQQSHFMHLTCATETTIQVSPSPKPVQETFPAPSVPYPATPPATPQPRPFTSLPTLNPRQT